MWHVDVLTKIEMEREKPFDLNLSLNILNKISKKFNFRKYLLCKKSLILWACLPMFHSCNFHENLMSTSTFNRHQHHRRLERIKMKIKTTLTLSWIVVHYNMLLLLLLLPSYLQFLYIFIANDDRMSVFTIYVIVRSFRKAY